MGFNYILVGCPWTNFVEDCSYDHFLESHESFDCIFGKACLYLTIFKGKGYWSVVRLQSKPDRYWKIQKHCKPVFSKRISNQLPLGQTTNWSLKKQYPLVLICMLINSNEQLFSIKRHILSNIAPTDILWRLRILWVNEIEYEKSRIISRKITFPQKSTVCLILRQSLLILFF